MANYGEQMFDPTVLEEYNQLMQLEAEEELNNGNPNKEDLSHMTLE